MLVYLFSSEMFSVSKLSEHFFIHFYIFKVVCNLHIAVLLIYVHTAIAFKPVPFVNIFEITINGFVI